MTPGSGHMQDLKSFLSDESDACLSLGLPGVATHVIDESSPLFNLSITTMAHRKMEVRQTTVACVEPIAVVQICKGWYCSRYSLEGAVSRCRLCPDPCEENFAVAGKSSSPPAS
jgi:hypothetical protein